MHAASAPGFNLLFSSKRPTSDWKQGISIFTEKNNTANIKPNANYHRSYKSTVFAQVQHDSRAHPTLQSHSKIKETLLSQRSPPTRPQRRRLSNARLQYPRNPGRCVSNVMLRLVSLPIGDLTGNFLSPRQAYDEARDSVCLRTRVIQREGRGGMVEEGENTSHPRPRLSPMRRLSE